MHLVEADPDRHAAVLRNIANLHAELDDGSEVELVVHGPGLGAATRTAAHAQQLTELLSSGVSVAACANTMRAQQLGPEALLPGVRIVPAGVAQLVRRQRQGWAYLRP